MMPTCDMWNYYSKKYSSYAENTCLTFHLIHAEREGVLSGFGHSLPSADQSRLDNSKISCPQTGFQWSGSSSADTLREISSWKDCGM